ncbi:hypothetical protein DYB32_006928 [Aphanomyces invadans]|uniref:EF-hand domain-containing protein n=1 Tax=Aphanomyces invadans TaxID=157072 RepID=A0A3R6WIQ2_9STRA|nr:hypothetical protein DYB32_006928 [Aphanomyces invadans]
MDNQHDQYVERGHGVQAVVHEALAQHVLHDANPVVDLFSMDAFVARLSSLKEAFPPSWLHALAIKANPLSGILAAAKPLVRGMGLETASVAEARHALNLGYAPRTVIVDSPCKTTEDLKFFLQQGCYLNLDNVDEIHKVHALLAGAVPDALIGLRINPVVGGGAIAASSTATVSSKFGIPWTADTDADLIALYRDHAWLQGVHVHVGSQGCPLTLLVAGAHRAFRVVTEFGRSVFAKAGITLSLVETVKHMNGNMVAQDIAGPLCFSGDVLARGVLLPQIEAGDYVVMHDTGAYNMAMYSKFNSIPAPAVDKPLTKVSSPVKDMKQSSDFMQEEFDAVVAEAITTLATLEATAWDSDAISDQYVDVSDAKYQQRIAYALVKYKCKDAARYFTLLDKDRQAGKLRDLLLVYAQAAPDEWLSHNFDVLDSDGDGLVSEAEMQQLLLNILGVQKSVLKDLLEQHTKHWTAKHSKQFSKLVLEFETTLKVSEKIRCTWHFAGVPPIPDEDKFKDPPPVPPRYTMSLDELRTSLADEFPEFQTMLPKYTQAIVDGRREFYESRNSKRTNYLRGVSFLTFCGVVDYILTLYA